MSFTRADYEAELKHALSEIGATESEEKAYIQGLRNGGALVLASGPDQKVEEAAKIMNRRGAMDLEKTSGAEPELPKADIEDAVLSREAPVQAGRIREAGSGAQLFVWWMSTASVATLKRVNSQIEIERINPAAVGARSYFVRLTSHR